MTTYTAADLLAVGRRLGDDHAERHAVGVQHDPGVVVDARWVDLQVGNLLPGQQPADEADDVVAAAYDPARGADPAPAVGPHLGLGCEHLEQRLEVARTTLCHSFVMF